MKTDEARSLIAIMREASTSDLILVSVVILPILLGAWAVVLETIFPEYPTVKSGGIIVAALVYLAGVIVMKLGEKHDDGLLKARGYLRSRLLQRKNRTASFESVVTNSHGLLTDELIERMIKEFPEVFVSCTVKPSRKGVKMFEEQEAGS